MAKRNSFHQLTKFRQRGIMRGMADNGIVSVVRERKAEILTRIAQGEPLTDIAHSLGLSTHSAILERIGDDPDYQHALASSAWAKLQHRENALELADSNVTVTRADRLLGHARWFAERVARRWFAPETRITGADGGPLQVEIVRYSAPVTIDATPKVIKE